MAGLGWQELVIVAVVLAPWATLLYLFVNGVRAATCGLSPSELDISENSTTCPIRPRPIWLVVVLTLVTSGSYFLIWFGVSWAELKRVARNPGMSPIGHALSLLIPVLGLFRVHAHFRLIDKLCVARGAPTGLNPLAAVTAIAISQVLLIASYGGLAASALTWIASGIMVAVVALGQQSLNRLWTQEFGAAPKSRITAAEWIVLVVWGIWLLLVMGVMLRRAM